MRLEQNAFVGKQHHTGNLWDLGEIPNGEFGAVNTNSNQSIVELSQFFIDGNENQSFNPPADPDGVWFIDESDPSTSYVCGDGCKFAFPTSEHYIPEDCDPTAIDISIANDTFPTEDYQDEMKWKADFRLYRKMLRCPALQTYDSHFSGFKTSNDSTSVGRLAVVKEGLATLFEFPSVGTWSSISVLTDSLLAFQSLIATFDSLRSLTTPPSINETVYNGYLQNRIALQAVVDSLYHTLDVSRIQKAQNLIILNSTINTTLTPANNQQTMNAIILKLAAGDTLSSADTITLLDIATQCPLSGGDAVYEARAIVFYDSLGFTLTDFELCDNNSERYTSEHVTNRSVLENNAKFTISPNPNNGDFMVFAKESGLRIRMMNQLGIIEVEKDLAIGTNFLRGFSTGLHFAQIFSQEGHFSSTKQIVVTK